MIAVYAGSFDPITLGHRSVVERAATLFERVVCLVAVHPTKEPTFSADQRVDLIRSTLTDIPNVEAAWWKGYTVEFARSIGAKVLVRGVRGAHDADYETRLAQLNRELAPEIATIFVPADRGLAEVSSSELKRRVLTGESLVGVCHPLVAEALRDARAHAARVG